MNNIRKRSEAGTISGSTRISLLAVFLLALITGACGGHHKTPTSTDQLPGATADGETLEKMLKFDARVQDHEISGDKLIVNVNGSWLDAPYGIKERAAGQWFNMFRSAQGNSQKALQVIVQHEGKEVGKWTSEGGFEAPEEQKGAKSGANSAT